LAVCTGNSTCEVLRPRTVTFELQRRDELPYDEVSVKTTFGVLPCSDHSECGNGGQCSSAGVCSCPYGWCGEFCTKPALNLCPLNDGVSPLPKCCSHMRLLQGSNLPTTTDAVMHR
jgi:hypothetical protein